MGGPGRPWHRHVFLVVSLQLLLVAPWQDETAARALNFTRQDFPRAFVFGAGTSAYQYEGATDEDGRSPSIWDNFTHAGRMPDKSTGDLGADGYHKYKAYRFSISWSRLIPRGRGAINPKGLEYYNNLINELVKRGIEIHVTLSHLDYPQILEDEYHGWLSPRMVDDFEAYADVCFREFGDRVRHWTTMDEPNVNSIAAYDNGAFPPGRCSPPFGFGTNCTAGGNSSVEPYVVTHNCILAHAAVAALYTRSYRAEQQGVVGINIYTFWNYPFSPAPADVQATQRSLDFMIGWMVNPLVYGDYPQVMKRIVGSRLPRFTKRQSEMVRGTADFIGINHYTSVYVSDRPNDAAADTTGPRDYNADLSATFRCYGALFNDSIHDHERAEYLSAYMGSALAALRNGANVKGYFVWSFLDVFELLAGYYSRYGLYHVDFQDPELPRTPKLSALWYSKFLKNEIDIIENVVSDTDDARSHAAEQ
ncbi:Non-cyanogenic beta-glucosidase [Zea mays]|uniref:Non-cyanogenic beta-glucosidase n=1 Tax=Zea mays TaxID=4577 RepID=A0A1D6M1S9_MAIZE|nr:Non-cyanogenic beta-glucosidase [Zea mays]